MKKEILILLIPVILLIAFTLSHLHDYDRLQLNQVQVIGSHNSYKQRIDPKLLQLISERDSAAAKALDYSHVSLKEQLDLGLLNLEIDVLSDTNGGNYANPMGLSLAGDKKGQAAYDPEKLMEKPGFKVLHIQDIDFKSHHKTFEKALLELKSWSDAHPGHYPVFVTVNAKDEAPKMPGGSVAEKFTAGTFGLLDQEILDFLGRSKLLIPDDIKGNFSSLEEAVLAKNWPRIKDAKGKFIFILDENNHKRDFYIQGHPSLSGRVMFANAEPGTPEASIFIMNEPLQQQEEIREMVKKGYIVRTRADANTTEARNNDKRRFKAALESGAQIITTDYYYPSTHFNSPYKISFEDETYIRSNPVR